MIAFHTTNATHIDPMAIAMRSGVAGCRGGLGMVDPISVITGIGKVTDGLRDLFAGLLGSGNRDVHIPAQNDTTLAFSDILDIVENACINGGGLVSQAVVDQAVSGINTAMEDFRKMTEQCIREDRCHGDRARRGIAEQRLLADNIIRDLRTGNVRQCRFEIGGTGTFPGGSGIVNTISQSSMLPIGVAALAAWLFLK